MGFLSTAAIIAVIAAGGGAGLGTAAALSGSENNPTKRDLEQLEAFIKRKGRFPDDEELKDLGAAWQFASRRRIENWKAQMAEEGEKLLEENPEYVQSKLEESGLEKIYWDEAKLHEEGTKENDLYDFYRNMGKAQGDVQKTELARGERDMQTEMAGQRKQLVEEVRKRRQNQLRSGLSSAQIANEEIQMMLMGQQQQQQTAQNYYDDRTQIQQQQRLNPYQAELQAREHIQGGAQGTSAHYAAYTGDPIATSQDYGGMSPEQRKNADFWLKDRQDN